MADYLHKNNTQEMIPLYNSFKAFIKMPIVAILNQERVTKMPSQGKKQDTLSNINFKHLT